MVCLNHNNNNIVNKIYNAVDENSKITMKKKQAFRRFLFYLIRLVFHNFSILNETRDLIISKLLVFFGKYFLHS